MSVRLSHEVEGQPTAMACERCGVVVPFDATLPYVKQTAAFDTGHPCGETDEQAD